MIVYRDNNRWVDCQWMPVLGKYLVSWQGASRTTDRADTAVELAARVAGVERLSSLWVWRLVEQRNRPWLLDPQPDLVDVTHKPWATVVA